MSIKFTILALVLLVNATPALSQLKKVRFSVAAPSIAEMPFRIAQTKGFYRDEGLDVEVIFIRGAVGMQALLGGSVDFTSASGSTIAAAVRGIPVKLVFTASAKPQFDMVALKEIRTIADLKGKFVGISSRGGAANAATAVDLAARRFPSHRLLRRLHADLSERRHRRHRRDDQEQAQ